MKQQMKSNTLTNIAISQSLWFFCRVTMLLLGFWLGFFLFPPSQVLAVTSSSALGDLDSERVMRFSLKEAILEALESNTDISVSRYARDVRMTDILFEKAKFDPSVTLSSRYDRSVDPLNRPILGLGEFEENSEPSSLDQNKTSFGIDFAHPLQSGGNITLSLSSLRTSVAGDTSGFLFNPEYLGNIRLDLTHSLLRNFGADVNHTQIHVARNAAQVESFVFLDQVLKVVTQVEQAYWELIFARTSLDVAQAKHRSAQQLLVRNRAKLKSGVIAEVEVLQAQASVASRVEDILVAERTIGDQEDQLRRLLLNSDDELHEQVSVIPIDHPLQTLYPITFQEAIKLALLRKPEVKQAQKTLESRTLDRKFAKNQLLPNLELQGTVGLSGLGNGLGDTSDRTVSRDFYNLGLGLVLSYPLGNRSGISQVRRRELEVRKAQTFIHGVRQQVVLQAKAAVRRLKTDYKRIESTKVARKLAKKQLVTEQKRLNLGLSTTKIVLDFQSDLAEARGNELRAIVDYNQSLANLYLATGTSLDRYQIQLEDGS